MTPAFSALADGRPYSSFFWKGRVAFYAILKALGVGPGDCVMVPGYTCVVVPAAVHFLGARSLYVDIDPLTFNTSLEGIDRLWKENGQQRIRALVVQHTYGLPADTAPIILWARQRGIWVIEDCCHVLGSRYRGPDGEWRDVGSLGDACFFSSQWSKPVSTGLGGWTLTANRVLAEAIAEVHRRECLAPSPRETVLLQAQVLARSLLSAQRFYWTAASLYRLLARAGICIGSSAEEELMGKQPMGYAKRMSEFQRKRLARQLGDAEVVIGHRQRLQTVYESALAELGLPQLTIPEHADPILLRYPVRVSNKDAVLKEAQHHGVELGDWFDHPLHPRGSADRAFGYESGMCPVAEQAAQEVVNLPLHIRITERVAMETVRFLDQQSRCVTAVCKQARTRMPSVQDSFAERPVCLADPEQGR
jgi:perosamine synthetase